MIFLTYAIFAMIKPTDFGCHEAHEKAHGRDETRVDYLRPAHEDLADRDRRPELKARGMTVNSVIRDAP
jgi:hypothetical protein